MFTLGIVATNAVNDLIQNIVRLLSKKNYNINLINENEFLNINESKDINILTITNEGVINGLYTDILFDIIIHTSCENIDSDCTNIYKSNLKLNENCYLIINIDDNNYMEILNGISGYILTYGFNSKATITASSINDDENRLSIFQQRSIKTICNNEADPQEFSISLNNFSEENIYTALAAASVGIIFDVDRRTISENTF